MITLYLLLGGCLAWHIIPLLPTAQYPGSVLALTTFFVWLAWPWFLLRMVYRFVQLRRQR